MRRAGGFTLLELLAVVLIIGLVAGLALPNFGILGDQALDDEADGLAAEIEWTRQRTMLLGVRHRLVLDLDAGLYWSEWELPAEVPTLGAAVPGAPPPVVLTPPERAQRPFEPVPDRSGQVSALAEEVIFTGVETDVTRVDRGVVTLTFETDGSTDAARVFLGRTGGREVVLELQPLIETVRVLDVAA